MGNILVTRSSMPPFEEYIDEIKDIWDTHWLTNMGAKHKELQKELLEYLGVNEIDLFTNGHMALELSLQAMNLPKNSEVITTPFTFASTTHAIVRNGLEPVFVMLIQLILLWMLQRLRSLLRIERVLLCLFMFMEIFAMWTKFRE